MDRLIFIIVLVVVVSLYSYAEIEARARRDLGSSDQSMDGNENPQCKGGPNDHWLVQTRSCDVQCTDPWETWCGLSVPVNACRCESDYVRQFDGACVPKNWCPPQKG